MRTMLFATSVSRVSVDEPKANTIDGKISMWIDIHDDDGSVVNINIPKEKGLDLLSALRHELEAEPKDTRSAVSVTLPEAGMDVYYSSNRKGEEITRYFLAGAEITRAILAARKADASVDAYLKAEEAGWAEFDAEREAQ